ncbi:hypothetical protein [Caulobacter endophyticus]|uniref:hypothetical protein n=1 Tax=Caulobacter endophyticus TaxID=2172652 RepID=UPI00240EA3D0|nr:hypothetical protein [Caulobacter endophyticus]MDG2528600.1 hypothetical protein [Caulobacter endophyticus]
MSTAFSWTARLTDAAGAPAAGAVLDVQLFDLKSGAWASLSSARTDAAGTAKGSGTVADDTLPFAPAFRLVEGAAVMSAAPEFTRNARTGALTIDFGQMRRLAVAETVIARTVSKATLRTATPIGGLVATDAPITSPPVVDTAAIRAQAIDDTTRTFSARLAQSDADLAARDVQISTQTRELADLDAEIAALRAQNDLDLAARDVQISTQTRQLAERDAQITALRTQSAKDLAARDAQIATQTQQLAQRDTQIAALRTQTAQDLAARDAQISTQAKQLAERDNQIAILRAEQVDVAAVRAQAIEETTKVFDARLIQRDQELAARDAQLADRNRLTAEQQAEIAGLRMTLAERDLELADIKAAQPKPGTTSGPAKMAVDDLATTMAIQLDKAQTTLKPVGFSLGAIQISAKGVLRDKGNVEFPDTETLKALPADSLSDLKMQFIPEKVPLGDDGPRVPDVLQLTESAVRRVLTSVGLVLEASTGPRGLNPAVAPGQAMVQSPGSGSIVARGARVMVIFADEQGA